MTIQPMIQPPLTQIQVSTIQKLVSQIAYEGMGPTATPSLLLLIEDVAAGDIVGLLYPALAEDLTYRGVCSVLAEAWETFEDESLKRLARKNLVRVHLGRASMTSGSVSRRALDNAAATLDSLSPKGQDWELQELKADVAVMRGKYADAIAIYRRIPVTSRPLGEINAKIGACLRLDGKLDESLSVLQTALKRESGNASEHLRGWHELQQEQGLTLLAKGDLDAASACLVASSRLSKSTQFPPRIDLAQQLSKRGKSVTVQSYVAAIATWNVNFGEAVLAKAIQK